MSKKPRNPGPHLSYVNKPEGGDIVHGVVFLDELAPIDDASTDLAQPPTQALRRDDAWPSALRGDLQQEILQVRLIEIARPLRVLFGGPDDARRRVGPVEFADRSATM